MKIISKGSHVGVYSSWIPAALIAWPNKAFEFLSMLITGHYPVGFLMLVYLLERDLTY